MAEQTVPAPQGFFQADRRAEIIKGGGAKQTILRLCLCADGGRYEVSLRQARIENLLVEARIILH